MTTEKPNFLANAYCSTGDEILDWSRRLVAAGDGSAGGGRVSSDE